MKTNKVLAVALSAGLVLVGASIANADEDKKVTLDQWLESQEKAKEDEPEKCENNDAKIKEIEAAIKKVNEELKQLMKK